MSRAKITVRRKWDESEHPRDDIGRFARKGEGGQRWVSRVLGQMQTGAVPNMMASTRPEDVGAFFNVAAGAKRAPRPPRAPGPGPVVDLTRPEPPGTPASAAHAAAKRIAGDNDLRAPAIDRAAYAADAALLSRQTAPSSTASSAQRLKTAERVLAARERAAQGGPDDPVANDLRAMLDQFGGAGYAEQRQARIRATQPGRAPVVIERPERMTYGKSRNVLPQSTNRPATPGPASEIDKAPVKGQSGRVADKTETINPVEAFNAERAKARITYPAFETPEQEQTAVNKAFDRVRDIERAPVSGSIESLNSVTRDEVRALRLHAEGSKDTPYQMSVRLREYRKDGTIMPFGRVVKDGKLIDNPEFEAANERRTKTQIEIGWAKQRERRDLAQKQWGKDRATFEGKSRAWLLRQAKARGIDVPRGTSDEEIINGLTRSEINGKIDNAPPGSTYWQAPELREELRRQAAKVLHARKGDYVGGLADVAGLYEQSREAGKTGTVPIFTLHAAQRIAGREGLDIRNGDGQDRVRQLLGMPDRPTGDEEVLHANELGFGDMVALGGFGGHVGTIVEHDDGKVSITTFGLNGQTFTVPADQKVKTLVAERRGLLGSARAARREARLYAEERQAKIDAAYATMANAPSLYEPLADGRPSALEVYRTAGYSKHSDRWKLGRTIDAPAGHSNELISDVGYMDDIMVRASLYNPSGPGKPYRGEIFDYSDGRQIETFESMDLKEIVGKLDKIFSRDDKGPMARAEGVEARFEVRSEKTGVARHRVWRITNKGDERQLTAMSDRREAERYAERLGLAEAERLGRPDSTDTAWGRVAAGGVSGASADDLRLAASKPGLPTAKAREIQTELDRRSGGLPAGGKTPETSASDSKSLATLAGTHTYDTLRADGFTRGVEARMGDVAAVHSRGETRQGVVTKVTPTKVEVSYTTRGAINENPSDPRVTRKTVNREEVWIKAAGREKVAPASAGSGRVQNPAKRGDLVLVEHKRSAYVQGKGREERTEYEFGEVASVDREGKVKTYTNAFGSTKKVEPGQRALVSKAEAVDVDAVMEAARQHTYPQSDTPMPFASIEDAVKLARPHAADKARVAVKLEAKRATEPRNRKAASLKPGDRILYKDPRGRGEVELDIIGEPRTEGGALKVRARNPKVNKEGDLTFKPGGMAKVLPAAAAPEAGEPERSPAVRRVIENGASFTGNPRIKLDAISALSDAEFAGLTPEQQDNVRFVLSKLATREDVGPDARRLQRRFGVWGEGPGDAAPAGRMVGVTEAARNDPNLIKLRRARIGKPQETEGAHGVTINPGDRVTMASDLHNRTGEQGIALDVGVGEKGGSALTTVRWGDGVIEQVLTPNLVKDEGGSAERVYAGILADELASDPRARKVLRGQPSTMDKIMSPEFLAGNFRYKAALLRREAVRHRGTPLAGRLTAAQGVIERLGSGNGEPEVIDQLIGRAPLSSKGWAKDRESAGARLAREHGIEADEQMLNTDIKHRGSTWSAVTMDRGGRLYSKDFRTKREAEGWIISANATRAELAEAERADAGTGTGWAGAARSAARPGDLVMVTRSNPLYGGRVTEVLEVTEVDGNGTPVKVREIAPGSPTRVVAAMPGAEVSVIPRNAIDPNRARDIVRAHHSEYGTTPEPWEGGPAAVEEAMAPAKLAPGEKPAPVEFRHRPGETRYDPNEPEHGITEEAMFRRLQEEAMADYDEPATPEPTETDVQAARETLRDEVFGTPERNQKIVDAIDGSAAKTGEYFRNRAAGRLGTTLGVDPLLDKVGELATKVSKQDSTMRHDQSLIERFETIAADENESPARRKAAAGMAEWGRGSRLAVDPSARQGLRDVESDVASLENLQRSHAESRSAETGPVERLHSTAGATAVRGLAMEYPGIERDMINEDAMMAREFGRESAVAQIRALQIGAIDGRIETARALTDAMRTDEGRIALQAGIQHMEWERRNLVDQEEYSRLKADELRSKLIASHQRRKAAREAEARLRAPTGGSESGVSERVRQAWSDEEDARRVLDELNAAAPRMPQDVIDGVKKDSRLEARREGITAAGMKRMPYEKRHFASEAELAIRNAHGAQPYWENVKQQIALLESRLQDPELRPATREKVQVILSELRAGRKGHGAVPTSDADVARYQQIRDFHVAAWRAASMDNPGPRDGNLENEVTAGLSDKEKRKVWDLNSMIGANAARQFAEWLRGR